MINVFSLKSAIIRHNKTITNKAILLVKLERLIIWLQEGPNETLDFDPIQPGLTGGFSSSKPGLRG